MIRPLALLTVILASASAADAAWPVPVIGFVPPAAGEHPRLLLRKADLPALREKAKTPVGAAIVARLKYLLGGGEQFPEEKNENPPINSGAKGPDQLKPGAFTVGHGAGYAMLWQLTGKAHYADLARKSLDLVFSGQVDRDERYSWLKPGTGFRLSGVHQAVAVAYDLCYDAWPDDYRREVVKQIQASAPTAIQANGPLTLEMLAGGGKYPAGSNHFGAYVAGAGLAALAIRGDPGADDGRLSKILDTVGVSLVTLYTQGYGDGGWFAEGSGSDKTALLPGQAGLVQALRLADGKDWMEGRPNARLAFLFKVLEMMPTATEVSRPARGHYAYGTPFYHGANRETFRDHGGWSADGIFAIAIGALPAKDRTGMAWIYENFIEPGRNPEERIYEARIDPLTAVYALVNWPVGQPVTNPAATFPLAVHDSLHGAILCRNRFLDEEDCLVTGITRRGPTGYHKNKPPTTVEVWCLGLRTTMGEFPLKAATDLWQPSADGSAVFTIGGIPWAVDFSGKSGCPAVILNVGGPAGKPAEKGQAKATAQTVSAGGKTWNLLVLSKGPAPQISAQGDGVAVGPQTYVSDGKAITIGK
ncbi:hypothetical protein LBMAG53_20760 [Planctomycetota bacterium]|nr:hypothetical protein LBMAG53_20760 [Planctomycetota bacterium]